MTEPTQSLASDPPAPSSATAGGEPSVASPPTPTSPASTAPATSQSRPSYVPESFWADNKVKDKEFGDYISQLATFKAADDSRRLTLPKASTEYKFDLPKDFTPPQGVEFKLNDADPLLAQAREVALKRGLDQDTFTELLGLYAGAQVSNQATVKAAINAEIGKLGPTGPARIDALSRFFKGYLGDSEGAQVMSRVFTASDVQILEKLVGKVTSGGAGSFTNTGREPPQQAGRVSNDEYAKMTPAQKLDYARQFDQSQFQRH